MVRSALCLVLLALAGLLASPGVCGAGESGADGTATAVVDEHNYEARKRELTEHIAALDSEAVEARAALEAFDAEFQQLSAAHPDRTAYLESQELVASLQASLSDLQQQVERKQNELAHVRQQSQQALAQLESERRVALDELDAQYRRRLWEADQDEASDEEIRRIRDRHARQCNVANLRFDRLRTSLQQQRSADEQGIREGIAPLEVELSRVRSELAPAMAKGAAYRAFLCEHTEKRSRVESRLSVALQEKALAETKLNNLPKPRPVEEIAAGKLRMAQALVERNPAAARERLAEIIARYPNTAAARQAKATLDSLNAEQARQEEAEDAS